MGDQIRNVLYFGITNTNGCYPIRTDVLLFYLNFNSSRASTKLMVSILLESQFFKGEIHIAICFAY